MDPARGLIQTTALMKHLDQPQASITFAHWKTSDAKGGNRRTSCKKDPPSPAPQLPAAAKQIKIINSALYLLQPDSASCTGMLAGGETKHSTGLRV